MSTPSRPVDTVFHGGNVWASVPGQGRTTALAVGGGRIVALGADSEVVHLAGPGTEVIDLAGRSLVPGFVDAHVHLIPGGFQLSSVDLRQAQSPREFVRRIEAFATTLEPGEWITGGGWDHEAWGGTLPDREWIDAVTPRNPVFVSRLDLHMALANSLALELAEVDRRVPDPDGGAFVRDGDGRLTGVTKDRAMGLVDRVIPEPSEFQLDTALEAASRHALSLGLTQVHDMGFLSEPSWRHLDTYRRVHASDRLRLRVYAVVPMATHVRLSELVAEEGWGDSRLWWGGVKAFVDGSLGSSTAWFHEPYADDPTTAGLTVTDLTVLEAQILAADEAGLQPIVHAIGDRANDWLLDVYQRLAAREVRDRRPRTEHAQHLTPAAIERFAALGVIASMQPYHAADDGRWAEKRIGHARVATMYALGSLLQAGTRLAFGSDWTVAPLDPLLGIRAAVTRQTLDGRYPGGWIPEERIRLDEALHGYTMGAAYAGYRDRDTGSLELGKAADVVVLSGDIFETPSDELSEVRVDLTMVDGTVEYRRR